MKLKIKKHDNYFTQKSKASNKRRSCSQATGRKPHRLKLPNPKIPNNVKVDIDKIAIVFPVRVIGSHLIKQNLKNIRSTGNNGIQNILTKGFKRSLELSFKLENGEWSKEKFFIQIGSYFDNNIALRIEYNPAKIDMIYAEEHIDNFLIRFCGKEFYELLPWGKCTRIDICQDRKNVDPNDCLIDVKYVSTVQCVSKGGIFQTQYFGSGKGQRLTAYNKSNKTEQKIRIERKVHPSMHMWNLHKIENPFINMKVYDLCTQVHKNLSGKDKEYMRWFISCCREVGLKKARRNPPSTEARKYANIIDSCEVAGWDLEHEWNTLFVSALKRHGLYKLEHSGFVNPTYRIKYKDCDDDL